MPTKNFTVDQTAELTGLSPATLRTYTLGRSSLVRGEDFYIHRIGPHRRRLYFTPNGLRRLQYRAYHVTPGRPNPPPPAFMEALPWRYNGRSRSELNQRLRNRVLLVSLRYANSPCADPGCRCITHRMGLPQADEYARLRELEREARERRKK